MTTRDLFHASIPLEDAVCPYCWAPVTGVAQRATFDRVPGFRAFEGVTVYYSLEPCGHLVESYDSMPRVTRRCDSCRFPLEGRQRRWCGARCKAAHHARLRASRGPHPREYVVVTPALQRRVWAAVRSAGSYRKLAQRVADRYGDKPESWRRTLERVGSGRWRLTPETYDRLDVALG